LAERKETCSNGIALLVLIQEVLHLTVVRNRNLLVRVFVILLDFITLTIFGEGYIYHVELQELFSSPNIF
jgi:hypothetical protein